MATQKEWAEYEYKKERYHERLAQYNEQLALWESLSPEEQQHHHRNAEKATLRGWTFLGVFFIGIAAFLYLNNNYTGNTLWLYTGLSVVGSGIILLPLYTVVGRLLRGCVLAAVCSGVVYLIIWFIQTQTNGIPSDIIKYAITGAIAFLLLFSELRGGNHASGAPERPKRPIPPT